MLALFSAKFAPGGGPVAARQDKVAEAGKTVEDLLQKVASLDHDRVLRRLAALINAALRTNYYQDQAVYLLQSVEPRSRRPA